MITQLDVVFGYHSGVGATKWLNKSEMNAWIAYIKTSRDLMRALEHDLEPFGLDVGDYQLLAMLSDAPDQRLRMCELAEELRLSRGGLTRRMDGVLKKRLVVRTQDKTDRRVAFIEMSTKGRALLDRVAPVHVQSVRRLMIDHLSAGEILAIDKAFSKISSHLARERNVEKLNC